VSRIPLGYDPQYFHPDPQAKQEIKEKLGLGPVTIGYFGRIVPQKGLLLLLKALSGLAHYSWKLLIDDFSAYTTDYIQEIKSFIKKNGLEDRVVFFHAGHEEIPAYMCACDLVVVPSITEGSFKEQYGRVVQEAIACGCLTIASSSGFLPNFFRDDIFIFKENDIRAIQEKIEFFINLPEAEKDELRKDSMYYIDQFFSIRAQADAIINSFRQIP
jgi:glycosyltransferase involved in cell wall biosynthesis